MSKFKKIVLMLNNNQLKLLDKALNSENTKHRNIRDDFDYYNNAADIKKQVYKQIK